MRMTGLSACLLLLILADGRSYKLVPASTMQQPGSGDAAFRAGLTKALHQAMTLHGQGDYSRATALFERGRLEAQGKDQDLEARFLLGVAICHFAQHRYQDALKDYLAARKLLQYSKDTGALIILNGNLSSLYLQLGEYDAAIDASRRGLAAVPANDRTSRRAMLLIILASLYAHQGDVEASRELFRQGILEADRFGDAELRANSWDRLGCEFLLHRQLPRAEDALMEAYRIRKLNRLPSLGESYRNLGILRLEQGDLRSASSLLDASITESKSPLGRVPQWRYYHARGRLRLAQGKIRQAHEDFRLALDLARNYRLAVPASDATRVSLEGLLQDVYGSFAETGSRLYFETGGPGLARETFEAVEENRAASLGARLDEKKLLRRNLPPLYWERMAQLEAAESEAMLGGGDGPRQAMRRLRGSLIELEAKAGGAGFSRQAGVLENARRSLGPDTILLSFHLARPASSLWVLGASGLALYRLPDQVQIERQASLFRQAILTASPEAVSAGKQLYRTLFGALGRQHRNKSRWLLSLDEGLFDLPFAALVVKEVTGKPVYLIERHTVRMISGAGMWAARAKQEEKVTGAFVGVGDAIYNTADARWPGQAGAGSWLRLMPGWPWEVNAAAGVTLGLSRLSGSGPEIEECAREWNNTTLLFEGRDATRQNVRRAVAARPAVVHFATHILRRQERTTSAMIALSLSDAGREELLGPAEIGGWNAEAGLVVLSGCNSSSAAARPGAGLMGLTRAWLMAGARAVVASEWATPDDVGVFFRRFYRQLRSSPRDPADALRAAQIEALRSHNWRSQPRFWAAYFTLGNY
jgi:Uncharacterized protein conserved in bacteria